MSKGSEAVARHRQSKLGAGWVRIDGLLPPESAKAARAMVECGEATSLIHAAAVALSARLEGYALDHGIHKYDKNCKFCNPPLDITG